MLNVLTFANTSRNVQFNFIWCVFNALFLVRNFFTKYVIFFYKIFQLFSDDNMDAKLVIIDYEYCSYNYRAFDFANHFHEWMFDYTNKSYPFYYVDKDKFPSKEQRVSK